MSAASHAEGSSNLPPTQLLTQFLSLKSQVETEAGFTPAVPQACHLPDATHRGRGEGWVRGGDNCPPPANQSLRWRLRPDSLRPSPKRATSQTPPIVAEERGGSAGGTTVPPAN